MDVVFLPHLRMRSLRWAYKYLTFSRPLRSCFKDTRDAYAGHRSPAPVPSRHCFQCEWRKGRRRSHGKLSGSAIKKMATCFGALFPGSNWEERFPRYR
jgi:hypothetical protein